MRNCKGRYMEYDSQTRLFVEREFEEGIFQQWGSAYEEFETGPGNYTIAIVELPDGKVVTPEPKDIQFINQEEKVE